MSMDLKDYAASEEAHVKKKTRCMTCNLPVDLRGQVEEARAPREGKPIPFPLIARWLKGEGHDITQATIRNHFVAEHQNA